MAPEVRLPGVRGVVVKEPNRRGHRSPEPLLLAAALALAGCGRANEPRLFELLPPERTGVTFVNRLPDDTAFNILKYMYFYDGGGVAVGDVNNDGLPDLYFTANVGPNRLYLNKGSYRFEDVTDRAGVADPDAHQSRTGGAGRTLSAVSLCGGLVLLEGRRTLWRGGGKRGDQLRLGGLGVEAAQILL